MEFIKKHSNLAVSILFALLYIGFWRIAVDTINTVEIENYREENEGETPPEDIVPADVVLKAETPSNSWTYDIRNYEDLRMYSDDSIWDLLDKLRERGTLTYEQTEYTYGPRITEFNGVVPTENQQWNFYVGDSKLTEDFDKTKLEDETTYTLRLE